MKKFIHHFSLLCILGVLGIAVSFAQNETNTINMDFPEFRIYMSDRQFSRLQNEKGSKLDFKDAEMRFNGAATDLKSLHLRGNNTLNYKRKSYSVELSDPIAMQSSGSSMPLKKFDLLNLAMDKNLWHNRWSFLMLSNLGIFPPFNSYCTVWVNDVPQGIYLLVEKPQAASANLNSPYMVRRGADHAIDHEYIETDSKEAIKKYRKQYYDLYRTGKMEANMLYDHLSHLLHTEAYFKWLGFNYFIKNGDYADELFLYISPKTELFEVMAWDYDDLLMDYPHEGKVARNQYYRERMIFSLEDDLDRTIAADDFVYDRYKEVFKPLLQAMDSTLLNTMKNKVLGELEVLSKNPVNGRVTKYLDKDEFVLEEAIFDLERTLNFLQLRRTVLLDGL